MKSLSEGYLFYSLCLLASMATFVVGIFIFLQNKNQHRASKYMGIFLLLIAGVNLYHGLYFTSRVLHSEIWKYAPIFLNFSIGPILFLLTKKYLFENFHFTKHEIKHLLPGIIQCILTIYMWCMPSEVKGTHWNSFYDGFLRLIEWPLGGIHMLIYAIFSHRFIKHVLRTSDSNVQLLVAFRLKRYIKMTVLCICIYLLGCIPYILSELIVKTVLPNLKVSILIMTGGFLLISVYSILFAVLDSKFKPGS